MRVKGRFCAAALSVLVAGIGLPEGGSASDEPHEVHPHQMESCSTCHMGRRASVDTENIQVDVCQTCHDQVSPTEHTLGGWGPDGMTPPGAVSIGTEDLGDGGAAVGTESSGVATGRKDYGSSCTRCHSFHTPTRITFGERVIDISDPKVANHCTSCHSHSDQGRLGRLTEGHVAAGVFYHWIGPELAEYSPSDGCLVCHDRSKGAPTNLPAFLPVTPRFETHASHPYGVRMAGTGDFFRPVIDPRIPLFDGYIECQTCHDLSAQTEDLVIRFETKYEMCRGCHTQGLPQGQFREQLVER